MKKNKSTNSDFLQHAKSVMGEKRFNKVAKRGQNAADELKLKMARELLSLNQTDLKGLSQPDVSKIEARKDMKLSTLRKYAEAMGMKVVITLVPEDHGKKGKKDLVGPIAILGS